MKVSLKLVGQGYCSDLTQLERKEERAACGEMDDEPLVFLWGAAVGRWQTENTTLKNTALASTQVFLG